MDDWPLPQKYCLYAKPYHLLASSRPLFKTLLTHYRLCLKCIFRIYSFEHPKIYNDPEFYLDLLPALLQDPTILQQYDPSQCCLADLCWLCQGVFQKAECKATLKRIEEEVAEKGLGEYSQFKLNVRIPNIIVLRNVILVRYLYMWFCRQGLPKEEVDLYYRILVLPFDSSKFIDPKVVLKWVLANEVNTSTTMTSTADDHPDNLVISIEQEHKDASAESLLMSHFRTSLGLEKKKDKAKARKQCLDVGHPEVQDFKCNANNLNKILSLKQEQFEAILGKLDCPQAFWKFINGNEEVGVPLQTAAISTEVVLFTKNIYFCGRYIKFSRYLSQTPWMVHGKKLTEGSLQEEIEDKVYSLFYPQRNKDQLDTRFHAGGREDIDVRMLQGGRPFVLEFVNPVRPVKKVSEQAVLALLEQPGRQQVRTAFQAWLEQGNHDKEEFHSWRVAKLMELVINYQNPYVQVAELQETTESYISVELKAAEMEKIKHYLCYIHSPETLTQKDKATLEALKDIVLQQLTPLRVLHRRTLMVRDKVVHSLKMHLVSRRSAVLEVWASAGTYIKEFVHGDLGRTVPSVGSLLQKEVDILQLDVGSLKEGEWQEGDEHLMKLERQDWME